MDDRGRPIAIWSLATGDVHLSYRLDGKLARIVSVARAQSAEPIYSDDNSPTGKLRIQELAGAPRVAQGVIPTAESDVRKYLSMEEDEEFQRAMRDASEYLDWLIGTGGFDFDLNRTPPERELCIAACDQMCSDGSTAYGTVIGIATIFAPPPSNVLALAIWGGLIGLDWACKNNCRNGPRCR